MSRAEESFMPTPGDRQSVNCRGCGAEILMIRSTRLKWIPCERLPSHVDGETMMVFADGYVGRYHGDHEIGHESHFAHCPKAAQFKRDDRRQKPTSVSAETGDPANLAPVAIGCGCMNLRGAA